MKDWRRALRKQQQRKTPLVLPPGGPPFKSVDAMLAAYRDQQLDKKLSAIRLVR